MNRAGQTTYPVKNWLGSENSKLFKKLPQSWSPGQINIFAYVTVYFWSNWRSL